MELVELKSIWDVVIEDTISKESIDEFVVAKSIKKDSKTVLAKIKRVMYLKFIIGGFTLLVSVLMFIGSFIMPEKVIFLENIFDLTENRLFLLCIAVFILGMLTVNFLAFKEIKKFDRSTSTIKASLQKFVKIMEDTIKLNIYSGAIFNAMLFTWIFYATAFKDEPFSWEPKGYIVLAVPFVTFILLYFLGKYEQKLKFGNYVNQLKSNLKDIEEKV